MEQCCPGQVSHSIYKNYMGQFCPENATYLIGDFYCTSLSAL